MLANKFVCHTDWRHAENYTFERSRLIMSELILHPDRLFPAEESVRGIARRLYAEVKDLPIVSPHGHTDPSWFADNQPFDSAADLLIKPDHYVFRMLYSLGVPLESLGVPTVDGTEVETDGRNVDGGSCWPCQGRLLLCGDTSTHSPVSGFLRLWL